MCIRMYVYAPRYNAFTISMLEASRTILTGSSPSNSRNKRPDKVLICVTVEHCVCVCVCVCVHLDTYMHACMHVCVCVCRFVCLKSDVQNHTGLYVVCLCVYAMCMQVYMHYALLFNNLAHRHIQTHIHTHTHTHLHTYILHSV